ncbi:Golgi transport complex subunit 6 [Mycoemilia scoparia]|uniref:Conserved oligomeric Golgi complex subunit 6 n=1 Tax=Mycoemilia scoparia TaxID=417184 RepID=A0A9W8A1P2_9FUNG|nr:Golgi transport complex subunit 6 [Mycoemilia scoparia]
MAATTNSKAYTAGPGAGHQKFQISSEDNTPLMRRLRSILSTPLDTKDNYEALEALGECLELDQTAKNKIKSISSKSTNTGDNNINKNNNVDDIWSDDDDNNNNSSSSKENKKEEIEKMLVRLQEIDLQLEMRSKMAQINDSFVDALSMVNDAFVVIERSIYEVEKNCQDMRAQYQRAVERTFHVSNHTSELIEERNDLETKMQIANAFLDRFVLSDNETKVLDSVITAKDPVSKEFFAVLDRIHEIRQICHYYLLTSNGGGGGGSSSSNVNKKTTTTPLPPSNGIKSVVVSGDNLSTISSIAGGQMVITSSNNNQAGIEIDKILSDYEEAALSALRRWVQNEIRQLSKDTPEFSSELKLAIKELERRPALYQAAIQEISNTRREALTHAFIQALVRGGPNGVPRAIDLHAADSMRYLGDMLAWVHQAHASEIELLDTLFVGEGREQSASGSTISPPLKISAEEGPNTTITSGCEDILSLCLEGLCRPLELRVQQTLSEITDPSQLLKLTNFLQFYSQVFSKSCLCDSALMLTMKDLTIQAEESFTRALKAKISDLCMGIEISPKLDVSEYILLIIDLVRDLIHVYDTSFGLHHREPSQLQHLEEQEKGAAASSNSDGGGDMDFIDEEKILENIITFGLDPMVEATESLVDSDDRLAPYEALILKWNLHSSVKFMLETDRAVKQWYDIESKRLDELSKALESELFDMVSTESGINLFVPYINIDLTPNQGKQSNTFVDQKQSTHNLDPSKVQEFSTQLSEALASGELDLSVQMGRLSSPRDAREIIANVMKRFVDFYSKVYEYVQSQISQSKSDGDDEAIDGSSGAGWNATVDIGTFHKPNVLATLLL